MTLLKLAPDSERLRRIARAYAAGEVEEKEYRRIRAEVIDAFVVTEHTGDDTEQRWSEGDPQATAPPRAARLPPANGLPGGAGLPAVAGLRHAAAARFPHPRHWLLATVVVGLTAALYLLM